MFRQFFATPAQFRGALRPFEPSSGLGIHIVSLDTKAAGETHVPTNDQPGRFGSTGKVFTLLP